MIARLFFPLMVFGLSAAPRNAAADEPPNIVLIMADDIGYECYGCYGSKQYSTPNIDRMAANGMRFEHCYSQPLCTPSRVKIMTGLSNVRNYAGFSVLRKDQKTFGHLLKKRGYRTAVVGKWQLYGAEHYPKQFRAKGALPRESGFDRHCLWQVDKLGDRFWNPALTVDGKWKQFAKDDYGPDIVTDYLCEFIEENKDGPFFTYYPMILVHSPFLPTPGSESRTSKDKQKNYEDMVAHMDEVIGRIVKKTEDLGLAEETLFLVTGDNGTHKTLSSKLGERVIKGGKGQSDDSGTRVALVAYWPGVVKAGQVTDQLVDFSDFVPTFQELAGAPVPEGLDGISFASLLRGKEGSVREWMYCYSNPRPERGQPVRFVRDQRWKLYGDGRFYDLESDVAERSPIKPAPDDPRYLKLKEALKSMPSEGQMLLQFE